MPTWRLVDRVAIYVDITCDPLHNQRAAALKVVFYLKGSGRITVINVPWYLRS